MENYIAILLLVVPGFISIIVFEKFHYPIARKFELELVTRSLIFSVFIVLFNYLTLVIFNDLDLKNTDVSKLFSSVEFTISYGLITIIWSLYLGYIWGHISFLFNKLVRSYKKLYNKTLINECCVFDSLFDDGQIHLLEIESNNISEIGFLDRFRVEEDELKEYSLVRTKEAKELINSLDVKNICRNGKYKITEYNIDDAISSKKSKTIKKIIAFILSLGVILLFLWLICFFF